MKVCPVCSTEYADEVKFCPRDGQTLRSATPASDLVGQIVADRYHILKKLGEGGMGEVYRAEHVKMGRHSAIKVMNPSMVHDPAAVTRFNREASNASRINHPNVCAIYDFGETSDGLIFLAMEFIDGETLSDLLEREGALPLARATTIFLQTAEALQAAHELGIVHRDLKPGNIMLTKGRHGAETVKVVDFGIAKAIGGDETGGGQKVTKTGLVLGTPEFMSPEQVSGDGLDGRSDLYSLALVLYRMLSGKLPFDGTTVQETMTKRLTDEPKKLANARPDLSFPPGLQAVFDTALALTPTERYQSVAKFAADIAAVVGRPVPRLVPSTEAQTVLLQANAGSTQRIPTPRLATKKRSLVPVVVGTVLVLGIGGAWVVLNGAGRKKTAASPVDSGAVSQETVHHDMTAQVQDSGRRLATRPATRPRINLQGVGGALNELLDSIDSYPTALVRDSARVFYDAPQVNATTRALAAFVMGNTYFKAGERPAGCRWVQTASSLDPSSTAYSRFVREQCN